MAGYIRNDTPNNIADGNIINASDLDGEFDAIQAAFVNTTGHTHDGTAAEGAPITKIGPTQDVVATTAELKPKTNNAIDLGTSSLKFKDIYAAGTAHVGTLDLTNALSVADGGTNLTTFPALSIPVASTLNTLSALTATANQSIRVNSGGTAWETYTPTFGTGDVTGPASSVSGNIATFNGITGKLIQDSGKVLPTGNIIGTTDAQTLTNKTISVDDNTVSGIAASSFVLSNGSGNIDGAAAQKAIPTGVVVGTTDTQTLTNKTISVDDNTLSGIAASSFVLSNGSGNIDGAAAQKAIPTGVVVGTTDTQTLTNKTLTDPAMIGTILEDVFTITDAAAFEIDPGNGSVQLITLGANRTPKATNFAAGEAVTLMVDDGTARTLTWTDTTFGTSGVVWKTDGGVAPTLNTTGYTVIVLWKVGTQVYGARVGNA